MVLKAGELYFLGELDHRTRTQTPFVKIGIVRENDGRDTAKRVKEHQTGNPRQIVEIAVIPTPNVERVETTMHGLYAPFGVGGEWFERTGADLVTTIARAEQLAITMRGAENSLRAAEALAAVESSADPIAPTSSLTDLHRRVLELKAVERAIKAATSAVKDALNDAYGAGVSVERFVDIQTRQLAASFDKDTFQQQHPEVFSEFLREKERLAQRFTPSANKTLDVRLERVAPSVAELAQRISGMTSGVVDNAQQAAELHARYLELLVEEAAMDLELELLTATLKVACGEASGITGVCSWKREMKLELKLDESALKRDRPDLYQRYLVAKPPATAIVVARHRGYAL
jgi:hypothetical protein